MNAPPDPDRPGEFASLARDRWMFADGTVILMYHKIAPAPLSTNLPVLYVNPRHFARQMDELLASGAACVPIAEVCSAPRNDTGAFCVTFDDGFRNVFDAALPVLRTRKLRSIQYIVGSLIGGEDAWDRAIGEPPQPLMDDTQIREWLAEDQEIGSHTLTHPRLTQIPREQARREIFDSKKLLEDRFGRGIDHFCYPYGDHNDVIVDLVGEAGYASACTVEFGAARVARDTRATALPRVMATNLPSLWREAGRKCWRLLNRQG